MVPSPAALRRQADLIESQQCTGVSARWCPVHGDCACADWKDLNDPRCPLHRADSSHAEATYERVGEVTDGPR